MHWTYSCNANAVRILDGAPAILKPSLFFYYTHRCSPTFGARYMSHLLEPKVGPTACSETLVVNYQPTSHKIPEDRWPQYTAAEAYNLAPIILTLVYRGFPEFVKAVTELYPEGHTTTSFQILPSSPFTNRRFVLGGTDVSLKTTSNCSNCEMNIRVGILHKTSCC